MNEPRRVALVTGATAGIGAEFARALAARSYDVVLVARTEARLRTIAAELEDRHGVSTEVLASDLETDAGVEAVEARLRDASRPVDLLVNNAGFGTTGKFHQLPIADELAEIQLNVLALVRLTHAALVPMVERGRGGIINVSSVASYQPTPGSTTYAATKAFVSSFTNGVHEELKGTGVDAMVLAPGFTHTEFHERAKADGMKSMPEFLWQSSNEVVATALHDYERGVAVCIPGAVNKVAAAFSTVMPAGVTRRVARMAIRGSR